MLARTLLLCATVMLFPLAGAAQDRASVPEAADNFYRERNVIAALSTPEERTALVMGIEPDSLSKRLRLIDQLLASLQASELEIDRGMARTPESAPFFAPSSLSTIVETETPQEDVLKVYVMTRHLERDEQLRFIRLYEQGNVEPEVYPFSFSPVSSREIHTWRRIDGRWLREPAATTLLSEH